LADKINSGDASPPAELAESPRPDHKPRRGVRGFLKEYLIIVVGVLTALGAEQAVVALHEHQAAQEARDGIRSELASDLGQMVVRGRSDECVKARLAEVEALLKGWSDSQPLQLPLWIGRPTTWEIRTSRYESSANNGRLALLGTTEQSGYASVYAYMRTFLAAQERERPAWARLQVLEAGPKYSQQLQSELLLSLQEAKYDRARAASATRQALRDIRVLKIEPNTSGPEKRVSATAPACIPLHTERAAALDLFYGKGDRSSDP
jgi:hypothetical protein